MNGSPRLRSAYPSTPPSSQKIYAQENSPPQRPKSTPPRPSISLPNTGTSGPAIPFSLVDAPSQRLYVSLVYIFLGLWRLYDYSTLYSGDVDGFWLFTKWVGIDTAFLYGLSGLRIPWLQWSSSTFTALFIGHGILNWMLMFQISIPLFSWLGVFTRLWFDRELAISERKVKPAAILHNSSLILGKQIIHILPEGFAMLNPDHIASCIEGPKGFAILPISINQTEPILIELLRMDPDTNVNETITITAKDIKKLRRNSDKVHNRDDPASPRTLDYHVKQTGLYRLQKVVDESKLEVQRRLSDTLVVKCPSASVQAAAEHKCKGDLSDLYLQVDAIPPFKVRYSKFVNGDDHGNTVLSIHPENLISPLARQRASGALVSQDLSNVVDISWARTRATRIPLNESLGVGGRWHYLIDEIHDACGNTVNYSENTSRDPSQHRITKRQTEQHLTVHERPKVSLKDCDTQNPIKVEKGKSKQLPLQLISTISNKHGDSPYTVTYLFTPQSDIASNQQHSDTAVLRDIVLRDTSRDLEVREPGLYTLLSVTSGYCEGEVVEPSTCLLSNPPEPDLSIFAESIPDKCAGNSIGLTVDLDLLGTPPFRVYYTTKQRGGSVTPMQLDIHHFHTQLELKPPQAGHYSYVFTSVSDAVYGSPRSLAQKDLALEQDVKPPAAARILDAGPIRKLCIGEPATFYIQMLGELPFKIEYEIVHHGRREKQTVDNIMSRQHTIITEPFKEGGKYALALTSITDNSGCKIPLEEEATVEVALQRPKAAFGLVDGKRTVSALETVKVNLPVRLQGESPWVLSYRNLDDPSGGLMEKTLHKSNDQVQTGRRGTYELVDVHDSTCPGSIEHSGSQFSVEWIRRPSVRLEESPLIELTKEVYLKREICQGDEDSTGISFTGTPPFNFEYEQRHKPDRGSQSVSLKKFNAGLKAASLKMESSEAGLYEYKFSKLGDSSYNHDHRKFSPLTLRQSVYARPSAFFVESGKNYKYCPEKADGEESVPITLNGQIPFHLELEIKHHASSKPESINVPNIASNQYRYPIPHRFLTLGTHSLVIRKINDGHGCRRNMDLNAPHVQISVAEIPTISALEEQNDYCVGDRISFTLSGTPPFNVFYTFRGSERKAPIDNTNFRRLADEPGPFVVTAISDQRSTDACKAKTHIAKVIHEMPSVRVSKGRTATVDIHEGGEAEILFEFGGTPPFHFTYTRSTNAAKGKKSEVLETRNEVSFEHSKTIRASDEGLYEVVSIRDKYCAFSTQKEYGPSGQKLLKNK